jgi:hypothetical protein
MRKFLLVGALAVMASAVETRSVSAFSPFQSLNPFGCINCAGFGPGQHCWCLSHFQGLNLHGPLYNYTPGPGPIPVPGYRAPKGCYCVSSVGTLGHLGTPNQCSLSLHAGGLFGFVHGNKSECGGCNSGCAGCAGTPAGAPTQAAPTAAPASLPPVTHAVYPVGYTGYAQADYFPMPGYYNPYALPAMTGSGFSFGR